VEGGKLKNPQKNPWSEARTSNKTQPTYATGPELNAGHVGGRQMLLPLGHPCSPNMTDCYDIKVAKFRILITNTK